MSNPFLNYGGGGGDLEALQNGSTSINVAEIRDQSLIPGLPVAANGTKGLTSRFITTADLDFVPLTNPFVGTLEVTNLLSSGLDLNEFASLVGSDVIDLKQKTTAISYDTLTDKTTVTGGLVAANIYATSIVDATATELINIDADSVDVSSTAFTYNGAQVATVDDIDITTLTSAGGTETLVNDGTGPDLAVKGLTAGTGVTLVGSAGAVTINATATTLTSAGGTETLVNDGTGPTLAVKGLTAGTNITLGGSATAITINAADAAVTTLTSAGGATSLVSDGTGPALAVKGLTAGAGGIIITDTGVAAVIEYDDAPLIAVESLTQNIAFAIPCQTSIEGVVSAVECALAIAPLVASGTFLANSSTAIQSVGGGRFTLAARQFITAIGVPVVHWPAGNPAVTRRFNFWTDAGVLVYGYDLPKTTITGQYYTLAVSLILPAGTYRYAIDRGINVLDATNPGSVVFTFDPRVSAVTSAFANGSDVFPSTLGVANHLVTGVFYLGDPGPGTVEAPVLRSGGAGPIVLGSDLDFGNVFNLVRCPNINGIRPSGGVYSASTGAFLSGIITPAVDLFVFAGPGYGSLSVPANTFQPGDSYALKVGGAITCANGDVFTLELGVTRPALADVVLGSFVVAVDGAQVDGWWELEVEFIIRAIGGAGVAVVSTNGNYAYYNANTFAKGLGIDVAENTNFRTDVANTLFLRYSTAEASITSFRTSQITLTKLF